MENNTDNQKAELQHIQQQIQREEQQTKEFEKKLKFEQQEHEKREEQLLRRQKTEVDSLEMQHRRNLSALKDSHTREINNLNTKATTSKSELTRVTRDLDKIKADPKMRAYTSKLKVSKTKSSTLDRTMDLQAANQMHLQTQKDDLTRKIKETERTLTLKQREHERSSIEFERRQKLELDKLSQQHKRAHDSLTDTWIRSKKYYDDKITFAKSKVETLKANYTHRERDYKIRAQAQKKADSDQRAMHGNKAGQKNFAKPESGDQENSGNSHRRSQGRW